MFRLWAMAINPYDVVENCWWVCVSQYRDFGRVGVSVW